MMELSLSRYGLGNDCFRHACIYYMHVCVYVCMCKFVFGCVYAYTSVCVRVCLFVCVCMCLCIRMHVPVCYKQGFFLHTHA